MQSYESVDSFIRASTTSLAKGPVALIFAEDAAALDPTVRHHVDLGFKTVVVFMPSALRLEADLAECVARVSWDIASDADAVDVVNRCIDAAPKLWFYYCYNAEFLFFPFSESRTVGEMLAFNAEERRETVLTYVIDLYAGDLEANPDAVSMSEALFDRSGYYALARKDAWDNALDRQMDFYGGLRWRMEEHVPEERRRIDRVGIFKSKAGLKLRADHTFSEPEYNTYACAWHHNLTAAICSFRAAKALKRNPGSRDLIRSFQWHNSIKFEWKSQQLLKLGLIEPGQWF
ncbi:MAG: hypothetical protein AAF092_08140 [Pseudomonadota bacterium]